MKYWGIVRNIFAFIAVFCCLVYSAVFFVAPHYINKKDISLLITKTVEKQTGLVVLIDGHKITMSPKLEVKLKANSISVFYPNKKQFLGIDKAEVELSPLALLKKEILIKNVSAQNFQLSTKLLKNGKTTIQEYLEQHIAHDEESEYKFSATIPKINVVDYLFKIKDEKTSQRLKIQGKNLLISQAPDFRYYTLSTSGKIALSDEEKLNYKVKLDVSKDLSKFTELDSSKLELEKFFNQKYTADVDVDLKIYSKNSYFDYANGNVLIDKFVFYVSGKPLPPSYFHIKTDKGKAYVDSKFYTNTNEVTNINADLKIQKPYSANINFNCPKADIANLQKLSIAVADLLNIKNNLSELNVKGLLTADFNVNFDEKSLKSNGQLKIKNASIAHKAVPLNITAVNALVDFSNNKLDIKKSNALVNNQPVALYGYVLSDTTGKLTAKADNLDLNNLIKAFPFIKINNDVVLRTGKLSFTADISGKLSQVSPIVNAKVTNFSGLIKSAKAIFSAAELDVVTNLVKNKPSGYVVLKNFSLHSNKPSAPVSLKSDMLKAVFDDKNIKVEDSKLTTGNANLILSGDVKNYTQKPDVLLNLKGTVDTGFLKSLASNDIKLFNKGYLPIRAVVRSSSGVDNYDLDLKILANTSNYITPVIVKNYSEKTTLTHLQAVLNEKEVNIKDLSLYYAGNINSLINDVNTSALKKSVSIKGKLKNINTGIALFENLKITTLESLKLEIPGFIGSSALINADILLNGNLNNNFTLNGNLQIDNISIPQYMLTVGSSVLSVKNRAFNARLNNVKVDDTSLSLECQSELPVDLGMFKKISNLKINADFIDFEKTVSVLQKLFQAKYAPGADIPIDIVSGKLFVKNFKMDTISVQNITADFTQVKNVVQLKNLFANAYGGKVAGNVTYNLPYNSMKAVLQGRGMSAESATTSLMPKEQKITGVLDFDADISALGTTFEQQVNSLSGRADFVIKNGHFAQLGRFEHFLYAQNLLSQKLINASLNSAKQAISPQDTGRFSSLKGMAKFSKGNVHLNPVTTTGPQMSMFITGRINMLTNEADLKVLGKVSSEVSSSLGLLGKMTIKDFINEHTNHGPAFNELFESFNTELPQVDITNIPALYPDMKYQTKNFQVLLKGTLSSVKAVKSFTWVNPLGFKKKIDSTSSKNIQSNDTIQEPFNNSVQSTVKPADFLDNIPDNFN